MTLSHDDSTINIILCIIIIITKSHGWSAKRQHYHQQSEVETSHHLTSSEDKSRKCGTSFAFHHKDTNQWLPDSISSYKRQNDPVQSKNG